MLWEDTGAVQLAENQFSETHAKNLKRKNGSSQPQDPIAEPSCREMTMLTNAPPWPPLLSIPASIK